MTCCHLDVQTVHHLDGLDHLFLYYVHLFHDLFLLENLRAQKKWKLLELFVLHWQWCG
jgi:hypothetical protein